MRMPSVALVAGSLLLLHACVGDNPTSASPDPTPDGGATCPAPQNACGGRCVAPDDITACGTACTACAAPSGGSVTCDGTCKPACPPGLTQCGSACLSLEADPANCGRCGRSCGGETCAARTCKDKVVTTLAEGGGIAVGPTFVYVRTNVGFYYAPKIGGAPTPIADYATTNWNFSSTARAAGGVAIDGVSVYFSATNDNTAENGIHRWALAGGGVVQTPIIESSVLGADASIAVDGSTIVWLDPYRVRGCTACPTRSIDIQSGGLSEHVALHKDWIVWTNRATSAVNRCPRAACTQLETLVTVAQSPDAGLVRVHKDTVYWMDEDTVERGRIRSCAVTGCANPATLVKGQEGLKSFAIDDTGIYMTVEGGTTTPTGEIRVCRDLTAGCGMQLEVLAPAQPRPNVITLDGEAAYWTTLGVTSVTNSAGVRRVAK